MGRHEEADASELALAEIALARAEANLATELGVADTIDLKAVGLATADVAALTIVIVFHGDLPAWWISALLMGLAGLWFFLVLRQREWFYTPDMETFWAENVGRARAEINRAMLAALVEAREKNYGHIEFKARWFQRGYWTLGFGLLALLASSLKRAVG